MSRGAGTLAAIALVAAAVLLVRAHTRDDALSADEPVHILSGYFEVSGGNAIVNIEHPPLMKILAGLGLETLSLPPAPDHAPAGETFTDFGHAFLFQNRVSADAIAAAARAPFLAVLAALILLVYFAGRARYGVPAALFASALVAFDPNILAHAGVVHTDLGAALGFLATVLAWDLAMRRPRPGSLALAALSLGLTLATKFSGVYLFPILLLQALLRARGEADPGRAAARSLARLAGVALGALLIVVAVYAAVTRHIDREEQRSVIHEMIAGRGAPGLSRAVERVAAFSPPLGHYLGGLASVARQNAIGGGVNFLNGRVSEHGFPIYFFVAFLAKSPVAFLAATAIVLTAWVRRPRAPEAGLLLLPVVVLFLASLGSSYNIGIRHLLPVYPLLALAAAGGLASLHAAGGRRALAASALFVLLPATSLVETIRVHPHELSYFNPFVGGPVAGRNILSDSNVDWGLDLKRLAAELGRRRVSEPTVVYFGGDDVFERVGVPDFSADPRVRGTVVAISAFHLAVGPAFYAYHGAWNVAAALARLRSEIAARGRPIGRVGYSMYLFELPNPGETGR